MTIQSRRMEKEWWVAEVTGRLDQILTPELDSFLSEFMDQGHTHLIVDLTGVEYINSGGLRALVSAWRKAHAEGGEVHLVGLSDRVLHVFQMVGFQQIFNIHPDVDSALDAARTEP